MFEEIAQQIADIQARLQRLETIERVDIPTVTGNRAAIDTALKDLLAVLEQYGYIVDNTTEV